MGLKRFSLFALSAILIAAAAGFLAFSGHVNDQGQSAPSAQDATEAPALEIPPPLHIEYKREPIAIRKQTGADLTFNVELALTPDQQTRGLMYRTEMAEDAGMLFIFNTTRPISFWMKNTLIPLDMLFLGEDGTILHIHENAKPQDTTSIPSMYPVKAVLELNGGTTRKRGIKKGDTVQHRFLSH